MDTGEKFSCVIVTFSPERLLVAVTTRLSDPFSLMLEGHCGVMLYWCATTLGFAPTSSVSGLPQSPDTISLYGCPMGTPVNPLSVVVVPVQLAESIKLFSRS